MKVGHPFAQSPLYGFLEQELSGPWTARDFYQNALEIAQQLSAPAPADLVLSAAASARLGYLLAFSPCQSHKDWENLAKPFQGPISGPGSISFWASENGMDHLTIPHTGESIDELALNCGICRGTATVPLRRAMNGEIL